MLLDGIKVIELADFQTAACGAILGDMGAKVIKIEKPGQGDSYRGLNEVWGNRGGLPGGRRAVFEMAGRSKKSVTLNLGHEKGRQILYKLIEKADIFYTNYREFVLNTLGADYVTLARRKPSLVYGRISLYGPAGPLKDSRGYDFNVQARSGLMKAIGDPDWPEPGLVLGALVDQSTATVMALGLLSALNYKQQTGKGQKVDVSMYGTMLHLLSVGINIISLTGKGRTQASRRDARNPLSNYYKCKDEKWILLGEMRSDEYWEKFCNTVGMPQLGNDPRFNSTPKRAQNRKMLIELIDKILITKTLQEWLDIFEKGELGRSDFSYSPIFDYYDIPHDPQALANDYIIDMEHDALGKVKIVGHPIKFSESPSHIQCIAPEVGQNTEEVFSEELGVTYEEMDKLKDEGVI